MPVSPASTSSSAPSRPVSGSEPNLAPLVALNPRLAKDMAKFPGIREFLTQNAGSIFDGVRPPKSAATTFDVEFWAWEGANEKSARDEFVVVIAQGSAYGGRDPQVKIRTRDDDGDERDTKVLNGKIVDVFNFQDLPPKVSSDGAGAEGYRSEKLYGRDGEKIAFRFVKVSFDAKGRAHVSKSGWTDSTGGAYGGRDQVFRIAANRKIDKPAPS